MFMHRANSIVLIKQYLQSLILLRVSYKTLFQTVVSLDWHPIYLLFISLNPILTETAQVEAW